MGALFLKYDNYTECRLCPHLCKIAPGKKGICGVRKNTGEKIELLTYGVISGLSTDPVEKKPFYHFFPGRKILSIGSYGCNMRCDFCQNWHISQQRSESSMLKTDISSIIGKALSSNNNVGLAFTYNEPVIWFEFMRDVALMIREKGMYNAMVSNGFVNRGPLSEMIQFIDAFNIDLKSFNADFYSKMTGAELAPVKESLKQIAISGRHLEITTLVIPGRNDDTEEMEMEAKWIADELGNDVPLHLSRYYPMYKRSDPSTPEQTLVRLCETALKHLKNVYLGNTPSNTGQDTYCNKCGVLITRRSGYSVKLFNLDSMGRCTKCGNTAYRHFTPSSIKS